MNMIQMKYFITAAKCLNFTKAADKLFITQPALSRQIASMEAELNMQLFIRNNRSVRLTPAAVVLLEGFEKIYNEYNVTVAKALNSFQGLSGELNIGILDGTYVGDLFPGVLKHFANCYPNVSRLDLIITLRFDVEHREKMKYRVIEETRDHVVVHKDHRLANASYVKLSDFKDDTFIMVSPEDSEESPKLIIDACKMSGFNPQVKFASSVQEEMLWVQAGVGVCILDSRNLLSNNDTVRFLNTDIISDPSLVMAWNIDNYNPMREIFVDNFFCDDKK